MTKILHIAHRIPPLYSGAGRQAVNLVSHLQRSAKRYDIELISFVSSSGLADKDRYNLSGFNKVISFLRLIWRLRKEKYSIIHIHGATRLLLLLIALSPPHLKVVLKNTMEGIDDYNSLRKRFPFIFQWLTRTKTVVGVYLIPELSKINRGFQRSYCIPNGVDIECVNDNIETRENTVLFAGGNDYRKGKDKLEHFWSSHGSKFSELILCGKDSRQMNLENSISLGLVESTIPLMERSKYLFFWYIKEGLPNILLEALFMNMNLIINESGYRKYEHLMLFTEIIVLSDMDSSVIISINTNRDSEYRRSLIMNYNLKRIANAYVKLYDSLISV